MDRNFEKFSLMGGGSKSLSARRAWIEMIRRGDALKAIRSLSARRAWIEMLLTQLRIAETLRRSPQGERG